MKSVKFDQKIKQDLNLYTSEGVHLNKHTNKWIVVVPNSNNDKRPFRCLIQCNTKEQAIINYNDYKNNHE